ncbi:MAG: hypothetical protein GEV12_02940 [Micromonosporaceae bacterium]|nr:hypothetical protein [Micromonosporaceae bacterium]
MADHDDDWLGMSAVDRLRQARDRLAPARPDGTGPPASADGEPEPAPEPDPEPEPVNLAAPEHRDKLLALFRWAAEGRSWEDVRDEAVPMFFPSRKPDPRSDGRAGGSG